MTKQFSFEVLLESWDCGHTLQLLRETVLSSGNGYSKRTATEAGKGAQSSSVCVGCGPEMNRGNGIIQ